MQEMMSLSNQKTDEIMTIITIEGGPINTRYLMGKSKDWLSREYMELLRIYARQQKMAEKALLDATVMMREAAYRWEYAGNAWDLDEIGKKACARNASDCMKWREDIENERQRFSED